MIGELLDLFVYKMGFIDPSDGGWEELLENVVFNLGEPMILKIGCTDTTDPNDWKWGEILLGAPFILFYVWLSSILVVCLLKINPTVHRVFLRIIDLEPKAKAIAKAAANTRLSHAINFFSEIRESCRVYSTHVRTLLGVQGILTVMFPQLQQLRITPKWVWLCQFFMGEPWEHLIYAPPLALLVDSILPRNVGRLLYNIVSWLMFMAKFHYVEKIDVNVMRQQHFQMILEHNINAPAWEVRQQMLHYDKWLWIREGDWLYAVALDFFHIMYRTGIMGYGTILRVIAQLGKAHGEAARRLALVPTRTIDPITRTI